MNVFPFLPRLRPLFMFLLFPRPLSLPRSARFLRPLLMFLLLPHFPASAQTVLFEESMGEPATTTPVGDYTGFDNYGSGTIEFSSGSTTDVRSSSASDTGYYGLASGGGNVFINDTNEDFVITGIAVDGFFQLSLSFGLWKGSIAEDGSNLSLEVSVDGAPPVSVPLSLPTGPGTAVWHYQTPAVSLPAGVLLNLRFNGESSSAFRIDDIRVSGTPIPTSVVLRSFKAFRQGDQVQLAWETAEESNNAYYEVQRSPDGRSFYAVGRLASRNDPLGWHYTFDDTGALPGRNYYRLRIADFDGREAFSPVRPVTLPKEEQPLRLVTNPVKSRLEVQLPRNFGYTGCRLYNRGGQPISASSRQDGRTLSMDVAGLPSGIYFIAIDGRTAAHRLRFLKL